MADIKTRDTVKGTIKTLDKAAVAGQKMKQAYIATKDKAERTVNANENTAEEYAADKVEAGMDDISYKAIYVLDRAGRKGVRDTKENLQTAKESVQHFKQQRVGRMKYQLLRHEKFRLKPCPDKFLCGHPVVFHKSNRSKWCGT